MGSDGGVFAFGNAPNDGSVPVRSDQHHRRWDGRQRNSERPGLPGHRIERLPHLLGRRSCAGFARGVAACRSDRRSRCLLTDGAAASVR